MIYFLLVALYCGASFDHSHLLQTRVAWVYSFCSDSCEELFDCLSSILGVRIGIGSGIGIGNIDRRKENIELLFLNQGGLNILSANHSP